MNLLNMYLEKEVYNGEKSPLKRLIYKYITSNTNAVYLLRKSMMYYKSRNIIKKILSKYYKLRLERKYGCFISRGIDIGIGLKLPHPNGIIIGRNVSIGKDAVIFQQVTIGGRRPGDSLINNSHPHIGNNVMLFAGCKVLGAIKVADGTWVGANAVLTIDTIENYSYCGIPAKQSKLQHAFFEYD